MSGTVTTISLLAEVFTIVGLGCGAVCFAILLAMRLSRGPWHTVPAAINEGQLNWLSSDGDVHHRALTEAELALPHDNDSLEVFHRQRSTGNCYLKKSAPDESLVRLLGIIFAGIGALAVVASIVVLFLE
ncbi:hypothetical protein [Salinibacterium sp.]|uniref:hypothetical protein n=1 Tax=Salinibacterium sp. TaxID=1915057 RepID=UPI00286D1AAE|nr:hypothetical protein [Salinibacterium sp.]